MRDPAAAELRLGRKSEAELHEKNKRDCKKGRIFAEVGRPISTAIAFANPNGQPADIDFYVTDTDGNQVAKGSFTLEAYQHMEGFLSAEPFNVESVVGTFSFSASPRVAVLAFWDLINAPGEPGSIRTGVAIANTSDEEVSVSLEITRPDGSLVMPLGSLTLGPYGQTSHMLDAIMDLPEEFSSGRTGISRCFPPFSRNLRTRWIPWSSGSPRRRRAMAPILAPV